MMRASSAAAKTLHHFDYKEMARGMLPGLPKFKQLVVVGGEAGDCFDGRPFGSDSPPLQAAGIAPDEALLVMHTSDIIAGPQRAKSPGAARPGPFCLHLRFPDIVRVSPDRNGPSGQIIRMNPQSEPDPLHAAAAIHNRLFFRIFQVSNSLERQASKALGITSVQWSVLGALSRAKVADGMPFSELAEYLGVSRQNLDGVLKRLERDAHVHRFADPSDRRAKLVQLTPSGRSYWNELQPRIYEFYRQSLDSLRLDDKVSLVHFLNRVNDGIKSVDLSRPPDTADAA